MLRIIGLKVLFTQILLAQPTLTSIRGRVSDALQPEKRMYAFSVKLTFAAANFIEKECDSLGYYSFELNTDTLTPQEVKLTVQQSRQKLLELRPKASNCCGIRPTFGEYFVTQENRIQLIKQTKNFTVDFKLLKILSCGGENPEISFAKNDTVFLKSNRYYLPPDSMLCCLTLFLKDNPSAVIEIVGKSWKEKHPQALSYFRAKKIKQALVNAGIDGERIIPTGYGETLAIHDKKIVRRAKSQEQKEDYKIVNRTASIRILSFDYDLKLQKRHSTQLDKSPQQDAND